MIYYFNQFILKIFSSEKRAEKKIEFQISYLEDSKVAPISLAFDFDDSDSPEVRHEPKLMDKYFEYMKNCVYSQNYESIFVPIGRFEMFLSLVGKPDTKTKRFN